LAIIALAGERPFHARRDQARLEAEAALRLQPGLPEAHSALGHYWVLELSGRLRGYLPRAAE
jgi:hypothetical protein